MKPHRIARSGRVAATLGLILAAGLLVACRSHAPAADGPAGSTAVTFPEASKASLKEGIYPDIADLRRFAPGMSKRQLYTLLGTPHFPKVKGGVLFLEDVNEHPYRVERCLLQLQQAGVLDAQKAVLLGQFTGYRKSPLDRGYTLKRMVAHVRQHTRAPILTGLPFGHVPVKVTLPVGRKVHVVVEGRDALVLW